MVDQTHSLDGNIEIVYASVTVRLRITAGNAHMFLNALGTFNQQHRALLTSNIIGTLHPHPEDGFDDVVVELALQDRGEFLVFLGSFCATAQLGYKPLGK